MSVVYLDTYESPVCALSLASDGERLCGLWLEGQKYFQEKLPERMGVGQNEELRVIEGDEARKTPGISKTRDWLDAYFEGRDPGELPPLAIHGTAFQEVVWKQLEHIPYGALVTYGEIAQKIVAERGDGSKVSARAVGTAVGRNPISIIVPCHRVIGANGSLTGYAGGIQRKVAFLQLEGIDTDKLKVPTKGTAL